MTSLSFILGAMPLVLAAGAGASARHSIGTGIIGGMIGATTLALFFVPLFYYLVISAKERFSKGKSTSPPASSDAGDAGESGDEPTGEEA
jgi:multidrug efflux pump